MNEVVYSIVSGAIAGGIVGQIVAIVLTNSLIQKRELESWLRTEKYKLFTDILTTLSAVVTRESCNDFANWPDEIRVLSQKIHLLFAEGTAPNQIADSMQKLFQLSLRRKLGEVTDEKKWRQSFRDETRALRKNLAKTLLK